MRLAELAARGGSTVATVKYYLREGLLPPGETVSATRAEYDESHVRRLRLVRALAGVAGLSLGQVREVLAVLDDDRRPVGQAIAVAHPMLSRELEEEPSAGSRERVTSLVGRLGWSVRSDGRHGSALASALDAMDAAGQPMTESNLRVYVAAAERVARADVAGMRLRADETDATTFAVLGTLLAEPVLVALRRMAQEHHAHGVAD